MVRAIRKTFSSLVTAPRTPAYRRVVEEPSPTLCRALLMQAVLASRQSDPKAAERWQALASQCAALGLSFANLMDTNLADGTTAIEAVLLAEDYASVWVLLELLPPRPFAAGRVACTSCCLGIVRDGKPNGPCVVQRRPGSPSRYEGIMKDGVFHRGKFDVAGSIYDGEWLDGVEHGYGREYLPGIKEPVYEGRFERGVRQGTLRSEPFDLPWLRAWKRIWKKVRSSGCFSPEVWRTAADSGRFDGHHESNDR